jgi:thiol-disulfide isomerase/thioredoxin
MNPAKVLLVALLAGSLSIGIALYSQQWLGDRDGTGPLALGAPEFGGDGAINSLPDLRLTNLEGREVASNEWAGHVVVLSYWATWSPPCLRDIPLLAAAQREYGEGRLKVVGIAIDDPAEVARFADERPMGYEVVLGGLDEIELSRRLGNRTGGLPYTVVFDAIGRRVYDQIGLLNGARLREVLDSLMPPRNGATAS